MPIYILLKNNITWKRNKIPEKIISPYDNNVDVHGRLKEVSLQLMFIPKPIDQSIRDIELLDPPKDGVNPEDYYLTTKLFKKKMLKYQKKNNTKYFNR